MKGNKLKMLAYGAVLCSGHKEGNLQDGYISTGGKKTTTTQDHG